MKNFSFLSLFLIVTLIFGATSLTYSSAAEEESLVFQRETVLLSSLGIEINTAKTEVSRGEFAVYLAKVAGGLVTYPEQSEMIFSDVSLAQSNSSAIGGVYRSGLMNGKGDGSFGATDSISSRDAVVALVRLTGYEVAANARGGYPSGYLYVADSVGITDGVNTGAQALNSEDLITLLYNTLHTDIYQIASTGKDTVYETRPGEDVLAVYHNIYHIQGRVTANRYTSLTSADTQCSSGEIEIDSTVYKCDFKDTHNYLGMYVEAYYRKYSSDKKGTVISAFVPQESNNIVTLKNENIDNADSDVLYWLDGDKEKRYPLTRGFNYIYNGKCDADAKASDLLSGNKELTFIDSDGKTGFETVIAEEIDTVVVTNIDRTEYIIYGRNQKKVEFSGSLSAGNFDSKDSDGNQIYIDRLKTGDVLSVYASKDNEYIRIILSNSVTEGTVTSIDSKRGEITLLYRNSEAVYKVAPGYMEDISLGLKGEFRTDAFGRIVYTESVPGEDFMHAYLINIDFSSGLNHPKVMLISAMGIEVLETTGDLYIDGIKSSIDKNADTALVSGGKAIPQTVRYKLDKYGKLMYLDTVAKGSGDAKSDSLTFSKTVSGVYNVKFGNISNGLVFGSDTLFVQVPLTLDPYDEENYGTNMDVLSEGSVYQLDTYDMNEGLVPKVVVYKSDGRSTGGTIDEYTPCAIVTETNVRCLDEDGESRIGIRIYGLYGGSTGKETTLYFDPEFPVDQSMKFGDVIFYRADEDNNLLKWKYDYNVHSNEAPKNAERAYFTRYIGYPYAKRDDSFSFLNLDGNPGLDEGMEHLLVFPTSVMKFVEVDMAEETVTASAYEYVDSYMHSKNADDMGYVMVYRGGGNYMDRLIIYKNISSIK